VEEEMNTKNNQRALETRHKIREVLLEKMAGKSIHQISVQEICKDAKIHRTTFYAHYDDIYDLLNKIELEMEDGISKLFLQSESGIYKPLSEKNLEMLLAYVKQNADFYRVYLNDFNYIKTFDRRIATAWKEEIEPVLKKGSLLSETELRYQFEYFNSGLHGVIRKWLNTNCQESTEELIKAIKRCVHILVTA
jgi:AcrR family transcriptional regulator